jgi:hypothetical protein
MVICRLDKLSRDEDLQEKLKQSDWDLIVCDEAHKMSASFFGGEVKATKRYRLGQLLGSITRHFFLLTATPHNGKEEDFQLFMALLDGDRFEGKFRDGVHTVDASDLMRRLVKEKLLKFDGTPLFPESAWESWSLRLSSSRGTPRHGKAPGCPTSCFPREISAPYCEIRLPRQSPLACQAPSSLCLPLTFDNRSPKRTFQ